MEDVVPIAVIVEKVKPREGEAKDGVASDAASKAVVEEVSAAAEGVEVSKAMAEKTEADGKVAAVTDEKASAVSGPEKDAAVADDAKAPKASKIKALVERRQAKAKMLAEQRQAKRASQKITRRAAQAERAAARNSKKAAKVSQKAAKTAKAPRKYAFRITKKTAVTKPDEVEIGKAAVETLLEAEVNAKIAEQAFKVPHQRNKAVAASGAAQATGTVAGAKEAVGKVAGAAAKTTAVTKTTAAAKEAKKPEKITPRTNIPGMISTASVKKAATPMKVTAVRPMPSSVFLRRGGGKPTRADLINAESRLGSQLFGAVPDGHRREFFHDQKNIWIWHEDWVDEAEHERQMTIRYEVRTSGVYKKIAAGKYFKLEGEELENFRKATHAYLYVIKKYLYNHPYSSRVA